MKSVNQTLMKGSRMPSDYSITILDRATSNLRTTTIVNVRCQNCESNQSETWTLIVGSNGISRITFYRCVSCQHTWREID
jgi:DNA-directed RNA polymerase subunit M/transcription elongation factor TFIIS